MNDQSKAYDNKSRVLTIEKLSVYYGKLNAVSDVSFSLKSGEILSIVGPSGSGKSTILHSIAGLLTAENCRVIGRILLDGTDITEMVPEKREIPLLFQGLSLFPHMAAKENISFSWKVRRGYNRKTIHKMMTHITDLVHLEGHLLDRYPTELSGGQQQRVGLARALASLLHDRSPGFLLLDEPLSSIDPYLRNELIVQICSLRDHLNLGILYVTHNREEAMRVGDRIVVIEDGRLHQVGTPRQIFETPSSVFVANFFGITNTFSARIKSTNAGHICLYKPEWQCNIVAPIGLHSDLKEGQEAYVLVDPSKIILHEVRASPEATNTISGTVGSVRFIGEYWEVRLNTPGETIMARIPAKSKPPKLGDTIKVYWAINDTIAIAKDGKQEGG